MIASIRGHRLVLPQIMQTRFSRIELFYNRCCIHRSLAWSMNDVWLMGLPA